MKLIKHIIVVSILLFQSCSIFHYNRTLNSRISTDGNHEIVGNEKSEQYEIGKGTVKGQVFDEHTKKPVSYGRVWESENENSMVAIDSLGNFQISLSARTNKLKFASVGNKDYSIEIQVKEGVTTTIKVYLGSSIMY